MAGNQNGPGNYGKKSVLLKEKKNGVLQRGIKKGLMHEKGRGRRVRGNLAIGGKISQKGGSRRKVERVPGA